ncbi:MAG: hypothetical protein AB9836_07820 [Aminipila sp.]
MNINVDFNILWQFLNSNFFQTCFLTFVGFSAWILYKRQSEDEVKKAAIVIKLEIDSIEEALNTIKLIVVNEEIYKTAPLYQSLEWYKFRNLFAKKMSIESINAINKFYEMAIICEDARDKMKQTVHLNRINKIKATQCEIAKILAEQVSTDELNNDSANQKVYKYKQLFDNISADFFPNSSVSHMIKSMGLIYNISNTPAYEELKGIINQKKRRGSFISNTKNL